jgi:catechol 2,3-dioxygenase-like lactoylglutathione lyase family enzyme
VSTQSPSESQPTFTGAVPVLPTTNISQATSFYGQLGFQVLHQEAEYAIVKRDGVELHVWLCPDRSLAENSSCRIQVTGIEALYQEYQSKGLLASDAAVRDTPWGTREFAVFDPDRVLITFVEHVP